jgi:predicted DsbA family dithiol-disulfide isomerase
VPFFIFGSKIAVSGAQEPAVLIGAMSEAMREAEKATPR